MNIGEKEAQAVSLAMKFSEFIRKYAVAYGKGVHDLKELYIDFSVEDKVLEAVLLKFLFEDKPLHSVLGFKDDQELFWLPGLTAKNSHLNLFEYSVDGKTAIGKLYLYAKVPKLEVEGIVV